MEDAFGLPGTTALFAGHNPKNDASRPHTIVFNPIVGGLALAAGIVLVVVGLPSKPA